MKYAWMIALTLLATPTFAQAPTEKEIVDMWNEVCKSHENTIGLIASRFPWDADTPPECPKIKAAYEKTQTAIDIKNGTAAKAEKAAKAADFAKRLTNQQK